jgi:hypothetical protein
VSVSTEIRGGHRYVSRTAFRGSLSSRKAKYFVFLSLSAPVDSAKSIRTTTFGFTQMHDFISSAVNPAPPAWRGLGKFAKGHFEILSPIILANISRRVAGTNPARTRDANTILAAVEAHDQGIEGIARRIAAHHEFLADIEPVIASCASTFTWFI